MAEDPRFLPAPDVPSRNLPVPSDMYRAGWSGRYTDPNPPAVPLTHYFWILKRHRWKIAAFVLASLICTYIVSKRIVPIYESTTIVDVDRRRPGRPRPGHRSG